VGALLAHFRVVAGLTQAELATRVIISESKLASIEQGRRPLTLSLARELDRLLDTRGTLEVMVENLPDIDVYPTWAAEYIDHEREAIALSSYQNQVLPGLLQSEAYAREVFRSRVPMLASDEIEEHVAARLDRQSALRRERPLSASFVFSEAVLHDRLGGREVRDDALRHLCVCADLPGVSVQVLPLGQRTHPALDGPFVLFETPQFELLAYAETQRGSLVIYEPDEVSILSGRYAMLRTQALNSEDTKGLLERLLGE
jgi:transcriptional regulator with XRE-family HTH domain